MRYAVVTQVTISDPQAALEGLHGRTVPAVSGLDGFVHGVWARGDGHGVGIVVFESREAAEAGAAGARAMGTQGLPGVTMDSVEVCEVAAEA